MKLLFKQEIAKLTANTSVFDENEEVVFSLKMHMGFKHKRDLLDKDGNKVAEIEKDAIAGHKHTIEIDGEKYHLTRGGKAAVSTFEVAPLDWSVKCTHMGQTFTITDKNGKIIAEKEEGNAIFGFGRFAINIPEDANVVLATAIYFATMDIIIMEDAYAHSAMRY